MILGEAGLVIFTLNKELIYFGLSKIQSLGNKGSLLKSLKILLSFVFFIK